MYVCDSVMNERKEESSFEQTYSLLEQHQFYKSRKLAIYIYIYVVHETYSLLQYFPTNSLGTQTKFLSTQ